MARSTLDTLHLTLGERIKTNAAVSPQAPALVFSNRVVLVYGELWQQVEQIGAALRQAGIGPRHRVAISLSNASELAIVIVAISCYATAVPLNPKSTPAETDELFKALRIDALVISDTPGGLDQEVATRHGVVLFSASQCDTVVTLSLLVSSHTHVFGQTLAGPDDPAIVLFTSGTTARPKLVPVTHENLLAMAARLHGWFDLEPNDRVLCTMPLYYAQGLKVALFVPLILGCSVACPSRSSDFDFFNWLTEFGPTWYSAGPTFHRRVLDEARMLQKTNFVHSLRFIHSAAAALPDVIHDDLENLFGVPVVNSYGLSEAGLVAANSVKPEGRKRGTVGKFWRGELAIRNENASIVELGGYGEIVVRGHGVTPGYIDDAENNEASFTRGWFRTGDLGEIDADGFLTIRGRIKELINRGGEKISPAEIDDALLRHPAVAEAAAFPVAHPRLGEDVAAAVVLKPGATVTQQDLRHFLRRTLAPFKLPRRIYLVTALPKGDTGKIRRLDLSKFVDVPAVDSHAQRWGSPLEVEIAAIWQNLLERDGIGPEDDFFELGGDSLLAAQMLLELERRVGRALSVEVLFDSATIRQLANKLSQETPAKVQNLLVQLQPNGKETPFIFVHGDWEGGFYVVNLARLLGSDRTFYSLQSHGFFGERIPSIRQMAQDYKQALDAAGMHGPYRVGGHCNGALIALELANQLEAEGRKVELVTIIDAISLNARPGVRLVARVLETILKFVVRDAQVRQMKLESTMSSVWRAIKRVVAQPDPWWSQLRSLVWCAARKAQWVIRGDRNARKRDDYVSSVPADIKGKRSGKEPVDLLAVYHDRMAGYIPTPITARLLCIVSESNSQRLEFSGAP